MILPPHQPVDEGAHRTSTSAFCKYQVRSKYRPRLHSSLHRCDLAVTPWVSCGRKVIQCIVIMTIISLVAHNNHVLSIQSLSLGIILNLVYVQRSNLIPRCCGSPVFAPPCNGVTCCYVSLAGPTHYSSYSNIYSCLKPYINGHRLHRIKIGVHSFILCSSVTYDGKEPWIMSSSILLTCA